MSRSDLSIAFAALASAAFAVFLPATAGAAESYDNCIGYVDTLPATLTTQGVWCLRKDVATAIASGAAITVGTSNVTIDCNGFKLGGLAAGPGTAATGIHALNRQNVRVRRCSVRGFAIGINLAGGRGNVAEANRLDANTLWGIYVGGDGGAIRRNLLVDSGGGTYSSGTRRAAIIGLGQVDIRDNTVSGVLPGTSVDVGVEGITMSDGFASGNRISGLQSPFSSEGINAIGSIAAIVAGNFVSGTGQWGIRCSAVTTVARDNTVNGFTTGVGTCANGGGNVHRP